MKTQEAKVMERKTYRFWSVLSLSIILFSAYAQDAIKEDTQDKELNEKVKKLEVEKQKAILEKNYPLIKDNILKEQCVRLKQQNHELEIENRNLKEIIERLREENERLRLGQPVSTPRAVPKTVSDYDISPRQLEIKVRIERQIKFMDKEVEERGASWRSLIIGSMAPTLRSLKNMEERRYAHDLYKAHLESKKDFNSMYIFTENCTKQLKPYTKKGEEETHIIPEPVKYPNRRLEIKARIEQQIESMEKEVEKGASWRSQIKGTMAPTLRNFYNMEERRYAHDIYKAYLESKKDFNNMYIFTENCTKLIK